MFPENKKLLSLFQKNNYANKKIIYIKNTFLPINQNNPMTSIPPIPEFKSIQSIPNYNIKTYQKNNSLPISPPLQYSSKTEVDNELENKAIPLYKQDSSIQLGPSLSHFGQ